MRIAIISDVHSNLEALLAVLEDIDERKNIEKIVSAGDIVGYNANPNECIDIIRARGILSVMGNHDSRAVGIESARKFSPHAKIAIEWTINELNPDNIKYLKSLPHVLALDDTLTLFHGQLNSHDNYLYSEEDAMNNLTLMELEGKPGPGFFGHTHVPALFVQDKELNISNGNANGLEKDTEDKTIQIDKDNRYLINPGSVGQPRDGDPRAAYAVYDTDSLEVTLRRVEYDVHTAMKKIRNTTLPERLAGRLKLGK